jgi:hypothetical protein
MSVFYCDRCQNLRDSDDGAEALDDGVTLICATCIEDEEEADDRRRDNMFEPGHRRLGQ